MSDRPVLVEWIDAASVDAWLSPADIEENLSVAHMRHQTVGWVMVDDDFRLILAGSRAEAGDKVGEVIAIPKVAVNKVTPL